MKHRPPRPSTKGDAGFLLRLIGASGLVVLLSLLVFGFLGRSNLGGCAARGFEEIAPTDTTASD